jgi:hypothetical protein
MTDAEHQFPKSLFAKAKHIPESPPMSVDDIMDDS